MISLGTVITGFPRSGTTLALRVSCLGLKPGDMTAGGYVNEPRKLSGAIDSGIREGLDDIFTEVLDNDFGIVKHPFASLVLGDVSPRFKVISVFRDLREVVCSVYSHHNRESVVGNKNSWMKWAPFNVSMSKFERVAASWTAAHLAVAAYQGDVDVWSYGFWDEWDVVNSDLHWTYPDSRETSGGVIMDVMSGKTFSDRSCGSSEWDALKGAGMVGGKEEKQAEKAMNEVIKAYSMRGIQVKTTW